MSLAELLLLNTAVLLLAAFGCLILGALILNDLPLNDEPGLLLRLKKYLTSNHAETRRNSPYPELELRRYRIPPQALYERVEFAVELLGWTLADANPQEYRLRAVAESRLFRFKDDIDIRLTLTPAGTELHVRARSRVGGADLGTNTRHIMNLHQALATQL